MTVFRIVLDMFLGTVILGVAVLVGFRIAEDRYKKPPHAIKSVEIREERHGIVQFYYMDCSNNRYVFHYRTKLRKL